MNITECWAELTKWIILRVPEIGFSILCAYIFYLIIPHRKSRKKKKMIVGNYRDQYKLFKEDIIFQLLCILEGGADSKLSNKLLNPKEFKEYFKGKVNPDQDRWHVIADRLDSKLDEVIAIIAGFAQATTVMNTSGIDFKADSNTFFQILETDLHKLTRTQNEYDDIKFLMNNLWRYFAAYNMSDGYYNYDMIQKKIDSI